MTRAIIGVVIVLGLVALAIFAAERPDIVPGSMQVPNLVYLLMVLLLVAGAGYGFRRFRYDGARALVSLAIWGAIIVAIVVAYSLFS
jgi:uncharacterized protein YxeA